MERPFRPETVTGQVRLSVMGVIRRPFVVSTGGAPEGIPTPLGVLTCYSGRSRT